VLGQSGHSELMSHFRSIVGVSTADDIMSNVLLASSCIEGKDKTTGALSMAQKAKALVQRWLARAVDSFTDDNDGPVDNEVIIERDVIVLLNVKVGRGASSANVPCSFRVMEVYEKYYNKWYTSPVPFKKWKNEPKPFKLKVRMLNRNAISEYDDVELCRDPTYDKDDICRIVTDKMILNVVGRLQEVIA